jgi:hypothetical protein
MERLVYLRQVSSGNGSWKQNFTKEDVKLSLYKPRRRVGEWRYISTVCNLTLGGSGQLHASAALAPVPIHYETGWAVEPVPILQKPVKFPILRIEPKFLRCPSRSLVTILTALFNLPEYHKTWRIYWFCQIEIPFWHQSVLTWVTSLDVTFKLSNNHWQNRM